MRRLLLVGCLVVSAACGDQPASPLAPSKSLASQAVAAEPTPIPEPEPVPEPEPPAVPAPVPPAPPAPEPTPTVMVAFAAGQTSTLLDRPMTYTAIVALSPGDQVQSYAWDVDGLPGVEAVTTSSTHTSAPYRQFGVVVATVTVTTAKGARASASMRVTIGFEE